MGTKKKVFDLLHVEGASRNAMYVKLEPLLNEKGNEKSLLYTKYVVFHLLQTTHSDSMFLMKQY